MSGSFTPSILRNHVRIKYSFSMVLKSFYIGIVRPPLVELRRSFRNLRAFAQFRRNVSRFETSVNGSSARDFEFGKAHPCLEDRKSAGGSARGHYFHQDLLVAQKIFEAKPERHLDVGSRIDGWRISNAFNGEPSNGQRRSVRPQIIDIERFVIQR